MRQTPKPPIFYMLPDEQKMQILFSSVPKGKLRPVCKTNVLVKHDIHHELKLTIMDLDLQITRKHPVLSLPLSSYLYSESQGMPNLDHVIYRRSLDDYMTCYCCCTK